MLKTIIFDIDGTLWQTAQSYVYAYHKLCDFYGVNERKSNSEIEECLGVRIDVVLKNLFPQVENQTELAIRAMNFSIEYLVEHPNEACFEGVNELLATLAKNYKIYLVSNCMKEYAKVFAKISQTEDYIAGIYTIEDGEKIDNIAKIAAMVDGKILFVGDSLDDYNALTDRFTQYFCYAKYGYKPCEQYDYSIEFPLQLLEVVKCIEIKERQSGGASYRVFSRGDNQVTLIKKDEKTSYFGFVKCVDQKFDCVLKELKAYCTTRLIGPVDFNTFYSYRFALDNYDWKLFPDLSGEKELPFFKNNGFKVHQEYVSTLAEIDYNLWEMAKKIKLPEEYRVKEMHGQEVYNYLADAYEVISESFDKAYLYERIERQDFLDIHINAFKGVSPDLLLVYRYDIPVAFCFCYEDPKKRFYVCKTIAIKKNERNTKVIYKLVDRSFEMMKKSGHSQMLLHFRSLKSRRLVSLFKNHTLRQKRYALLEFNNDK